MTTSKLIQAYYLAKSEGDDIKMTKLLDDEIERRNREGGNTGTVVWVESDIYYEYDDSRGLLNFSLYYQKQTLNNSGTYYFRKHEFIYENGDIFCDGLPYLTSDFYYLLKELPISKRIPNYADIMHKEETITFNGGDLMKYMFVKNPHLFLNTDKIDALLRSYLTAASVNLFVKFQVPFDFSLGHVIFNKRVEYLITKHFHSILNDVKISDKTLSIINKCGWEMIGLSEMSELINLYLLTGATGDMIFFSKGNECVGMLNEEYSKQVIACGNIGHRNNHIITLKAEIEAEHVIKIMNHEKVS